MLKLFIKLGDVLHLMNTDEVPTQEKGNASRGIPYESVQEEFTY